MKKAKEVLKKQIELIKPDKEILEKIKRVFEKFCLGLEKKLKQRKINAEVFIGGSLAKNTLVKKDKYDVDVFVRFSEKYKDSKISKLLGKIVGRNAKKIHGSRDYYQLIIEGIIMEIIPVVKIKNPEEARNVTDLSYFHVNYISKKIKENKKLADEIILAKTFCHSQNVYGAESYINGFSGYSLELLICHYGNFLKFIKEIAKYDSKEKIIIDDAGFYNKKQDILIEMNEAKIQNPIILIDPTFKERNALASLSEESFYKFRKACMDFLKNPSSEFFKRREIFDDLKKYKNLKKISVKTTKQKGDIAGTKSKKFFNFFTRHVEKEFEIIRADFDYDDEKNIAYFYFVLGKKPDSIIRGPPITSVEGMIGFKKAHPDAFIKGNVAYARVKHELKFEEFLKLFLEKNKVIIKEMSVKEIKLMK